MTNPLPPFVHRLSSLLDETVEDPMTADEHAEVERRCDEMRHARAVAEINSRDYLIGARRSVA